MRAIVAALSAIGLVLLSSTPADAAPSVRLVVTSTQQVAANWYANGNSAEVHHRGRYVKRAAVHPGTYYGINAVGSGRVTCAIYVGAKRVNYHHSSGSLASVLCSTITRY